ncbi:hypothetical protein BDV30DRAFT_175290 [Aspergillus minisclerotigenes]|uniref:Uncharacterized protein n=1 Tax=Aspergillus minisclerotigenes TaxID=656917 RepID=A0A5N6IUQ0_9EURO|nr:hypothetical protein BDV30DRAFT_175290 [Aspergillus minisclerotigenes]
MFALSLPSNFSSISCLFDFFLYIFFISRNQDSQFLKFMEFPSGKKKKKKRKRLFIHTVHGRLSTYRLFVRFSVLLFFFFFSFAFSYSLISNLA